MGFGSVERVFFCLLSLVYIQVNSIDKLMWGRSAVKSLYKFNLRIWDSLLGSNQGKFLHDWLSYEKMVDFSELVLF